MIMRLLNVSNVHLNANNVRLNASNYKLSGRFKVRLDVIKA